MKVRKLSATTLGATVSSDKEVSKATGFTRDFEEFEPFHRSPKEEKGRHAANSLDFGKHICNQIDYTSLKCDNGCIGEKCGLSNTFRSISDIKKKLISETHFDLKINSNKNWGKEQYQKWGLGEMALS